jgi:uncharacterized protein (DUF1800 family)
MGDENSTLSAADARHLLLRTCFGAPKAVGPKPGNQTPLARGVTAFTGLTRGQAVDQLLDFKPSRFKPRGKDIDAARASWIKYMIRTPHSLQEKLVLFWHDHFSTGYDKVGRVDLMANQNKLLRQFCKGNFRDLVKAINRNAAMMEYLDTVRNHAEEPNENYARELQELFTLGAKDFAGNPNYDQADIVQIARAFSGWDYDGKGVAQFNDYDHDYTADFPARGDKVIYKTHGAFGAAGVDFTQPNGEGEAEIDRVVDIIFGHKDTDLKNTVARFIAGKLLTYFAQPGPKRPPQPALLPVIDAVVAASGFDTNWDISALLRAIFVHDAFYETAAAAPFGASTKKSVKWPIDYVVTTLRVLGMRLRGSDQYVNFSSFSSILNYLADMGQVLLEPPSVFGWDWETAWLNSATLLERYSLAADIIAARGPGRTAFQSHKLIDEDALTTGGTTAANGADVVDAVTDVLGVTDQFTATERTALITYVGTTVDLSNETVRNTKLNGLFGLVLQSPVYQLI